MGEGGEWKAVSGVERENCCTEQSKFRFGGDPQGLSSSRLYYLLCLQQQQQTSISSIRGVKLGLRYSTEVKKKSLGMKDLAYKGLRPWYHPLKRVIILHHSLQCPANSLSQTTPVE